MPITKARPQNAKATSKVRGCGVIATQKPRTANAPGHANPPAPLTADEREMLIARVAYFRAEKRGFAPGAELQDWVEAEAEVLRLIGGG